MSKNPYAVAMFTIAKEDNHLLEAKESFDIFIDFWNNNEEFRKVLLAPNIPLENKKAIVKASFKNLYLDFQYFLAVVLDNHKERKLSEIYNSFIELFREHEKILVVNITSSKELTAKEEAHFLQIFSKKYASYEIVLEKKVDPSLLAGYRFLINGKELDLSLQNELASLKEGL